ncbi:LuxR C-terminal-related transcriptional regulator [Cohnella cellulosilytica]|uniref:LuxR C-terminal-related transcriptional regulator n=1 Tax=Cohnella cellulosilytica TaxID=986710 RepID=A0ABW2FB62_9BACL
MIRSPESVLLYSKTRLPVARKSLVERSRLIERLELAVQGRLTLVSAPAGFGKTTLLGQWLSLTERDASWVSLEEADSDPVRFWRYAAEALSPLIETDERQEYEQLVRTFPGVSASTFLDAFMNRLCNLSRPAVLVLDDYHAITEPRIHDSLAYFIEHKPFGLHLVLSSRSELPFPVSRWIARDELTVIDASQLLFTAEEAEGFCREASSFLEPHHVRKLHERTEGWITGLQLASISLREAEDREAFIDRFKGHHRHVADYLFHEVVAGLPEEMRHFLYATSALRRLDAKSCDAVTGRADGRSMLERLKSRNLFLVPLDDYDDWFRYHRLFADFLRNRVKESDPKLWRSANLAAAESLAARGLLDEAIDCALAGGDYDLAERCLERHAPDVLKRGEFPTLLRWFDGFPPETKLSADMALLRAFLYVVTGQRELAGRCLEQLEASARSPDAGEDRQRLRSGLLFVRSNLLFTFGEFEQWFAFSDGILDEFLPRNPLFFNFNYNLTEPLARRTAFGLKGVLSAQTEQIGRLFAGALERHGWGESLINLYVLQALAEGFYEWDRFEESAELLERIERAAHRSFVPGLFVPCRITQTNLYWFSGQRELAHETLDEAEARVAGPGNEIWSGFLASAKARLHLMEGSTNLAKKEVAKLRIEAKDRPSYHREYDYLTLCRLLSAQRKEAEALRLLQRMKPQAAREGSLAGLTEIGLLQAELLDRTGQRAEAMKTLREAIAIGEANGYVRTFLEGGVRTEKLLRKYLASLDQENPGSGIAGSRTYVSGLLARFPDDAREEVAAAQGGLIEPLTRAEIRLLDLIRLGESNKRIAEILSLSEGSVKVYSSRIYGKLGVSSRTQAVIAAQRLGLLRED